MVFLILGLFLVFLAFLMVRVERKKEFNQGANFQKTLLSKADKINPFKTIEKKVDNLNNKVDSEVDTEKEELLKILREIKNESPTKIETSKDDKNKEEKNIEDKISDEEPIYNEPINEIIEVVESLKELTEEKANLKEDKTEKTIYEKKIYAYRDGRNLIINEKHPIDSITSKVLTLRDEGYSIQNISKELNRGVREVEMILNINKKS